MLTLTEQLLKEGRTDGGYFPKDWWEAQICTHCMNDPNFVDRPLGKCKVCRLNTPEGKAIYMKELSALMKERDEAFEQYKSRCKWWRRIIKYFTEANR